MADKKRINVTADEFSFNEDGALVIDNDKVKEAIRTRVQDHDESPWGVGIIIIPAPEDDMEE